MRPCQRVTQYTRRMRDLRMYDKGDSYTARRNTDCE